MSGKMVFGSKIKLDYYNPCTDQIRREILEVSVNARLTRRRRKTPFELLSTPVPSL